jgi:RHS repeat-associated protein
VSHGYTGHEHEDELGLVNMGGRIYSPRLRRFLTADPIVAVPFGQGLNAYSYVMGDPMNLVDPSGWQAVPTAGGEEEHAINEDAPDDELPSFGARAVVAAPTGAADAPAAERAGAGAAGQAPAATERGGAGPVVIADLSNVADLFDLDLAGYDEGSGRITNFHDAGRSADAMTLLLAERTTLEGRVDVAARRALAAAASLGPGIGEVQDLLLLIDPRALFDDRVMAGVSMLASVVTGGGALNFAAVRAAGGAGRLRALGGGAWESAAGLRYGPGSGQGNRVLHVLEHAADIPGRAGPHGVFAGGRSSVIGTIDEAYGLARAGGPGVSVAQQGARTVYTVDMGRSVGFVGGQAGAALGNPAASHVRLVLEGTNVITALPVIP